MSEFSRASSKIVDLDEEIARLKQAQSYEINWEMAQDQYERAMAMVKERDFITGVHTKYVTKRNLVDSVTGNSRFGAKMISRIDEMNTKIGILRPQCSALAEKISSEYVRVKAEYDAANEANLVSKEPTVVFLSASEALSEPAVETASPERVEKERIEREELNVLANQIRERKREERSEINARDAQVLKLNEISCDKKSFQDCVRRIKPIQDSNTVTMESMLEEQDQEEALQVLRMLIDNIISKPDDKMLRSLNLSNEKLKDELFRFPGGKEAILSLGFKAYPATAESEPPLEDEITLIMDEPNPESHDGMEKWKAWYDGIKACRKVLGE